MVSVFEKLDSYLPDDTKIQSSPYFGERSPLVVYLNALKIFDEWASGDDDNIGILLKPFYNIPKGVIVKIEPQDSFNYKIYFADKQLSVEEIGLFGEVEYNLNFFHKIGIPVKCIDVSYGVKFAINNESICSNPFEKTITFEQFYDSWLNKVNCYRQQKGWKPHTK